MEKNTRTFAGIWRKTQGLVRETKTWATHIAYNPVEHFNTIVFVRNDLNTYIVNDWMIYKLLLIES